MEGIAASICGSLSIPQHHRFLQEDLSSIQYPDSMLLDTPSLHVYDWPCPAVLGFTFDVTFLQERLSGHVGRARARPLYITRDREHMQMTWRRVGAAAECVGCSLLQWWAMAGCL